MPGIGVGQLPEALIDPSAKKLENRVIEDDSTNSTQNPVETKMKEYLAESQKRKAKKEDFLQSLNETQLKKVEELHADHHQEGKPGPFIPEHHAEVKLEGRHCLNLFI